MSMTDQSQPNSLAQRSYRWVLLLFALWTLLGGNGRARAFEPLAEHVAGQARQQAAADLKSAQDDVQRAQAAAKAARALLDAFLTKHFAMPRQAELALPPASPPAATELGTSENPEATRLQSQLDELRAERERLLATLTEAHPEVVDVDGKISALETRLADLGARAGPSSAPVSDDTNSARDRSWQDFAEQQKQQSQDDAAEYQRLFDAWEAAEKALETARSAEARAAERLAAIPLHPVPQPLAGRPAPAKELPRAWKENAPIETKRTANRDERSVLTVHSATPSSATQTLALASLAIALAIAALAAVRLARSSADPLFSSADEAAAALAIPVVGIVPRATTGAARAIVPARNGLKQLGKLLLAVLVFFVVAYSIKNADEIWQFCADPVPGLRSLFGL
jgi:hypothetical protein